MREVARLTAMAVATTIGVSAAAQAPCPPPPELAGWARPAPLVAAATPADKPVATLAPGRAAVVTLAPADRVRFAAVPPRAGGVVRYGGALDLSIALPGIYRLALSGPAWIDVVAAGGVAVPTVAHGHGPDCSSARKLVDFALARGRYRLQLSDALAPTLTVMAVRLGP